MLKLSGGHLVQIHASAPCSHEVIEAFFSAAPDQITAIMVADPATYAAVQSKLSAVLRDPIFFFDSNMALAQIMGPSDLDPDKVVELLRWVIGEALLTSGGGPVRFYGEVSDLLCRQQNFLAALQLEEIATRFLASDPQASLLCGYTLDHLGTEEGAAHLRTICARHDQIIRAESFAALRCAEASAGARQYTQGAFDRLEEAAVRTPATTAQVSGIPKIYIIDDDRSIRTSLMRLFATKQTQARAFDSAEAFLAELDGLPPGTMIVDMQLGGMGGLDLLGKMAGAGMRWPAVVISGSQDGHEEAVSAQLGPDCYLRKPFDVEALLRALVLVGQQDQVP